MIRWDLTDVEKTQIESTLRREAARLGDITRHKPSESVSGRKLDIDRLLSSLAKAQETAEQFDLACYCDTNYNFHSKTMAVSFRVGDEATVHRQEFAILKPPPDEYLGIIAVLQTLQERSIKGRVRIFSDAARCTLALQMGLRYKVPTHSANQSPRNSELLRETHNVAIALTKQLLNEGCHVEFTHKHRNFINNALGIK